MFLRKKAVNISLIVVAVKVGMCASTGNNNKVYTVNSAQGTIHFCSIGKRNIKDIIKSCEKLLSATECL